MLVDSVSTDNRSVVENFRISEYVISGKMKIEANLLREMRVRKLDFNPKDPS